MPRSPLEKLAAVAPETADGFKALRRGALTDGPLDHAVLELVVVGALAATGQHGALRVHLRRLLEIGTDVAAIRQAVVVPLGAACTLTQTVDALDIVDELLSAATL